MQIPDYFDAQERTAAEAVLEGSADETFSVSPSCVYAAKDGIMFCIEWLGGTIDTIGGAYFWARQETQYLLDTSTIRPEDY